MRNKNKLSINSLLINVKYKNFNDYGNYNIRSLFIFFTFFIFIPIIWNIIRSITFPDWNILLNQIFNQGIETNKNLIISFYLFEVILIKIFSPMIACIFLWKKDTNKFWKNRYWIIFFFNPVRFVIAEIFSFIMIDYNTMLLIINIIIPGIILIFYLWKNNNIFEQVKINFNKDNFWKFFSTLFLSVVSFILMLYILNLFTISIGGGVSSNESNIRELMNSPHSIFILFFTVVVVAPLLEEFVFRKAISDIANNKIWVWPITTLFFAFSHISYAGDWINIFVYLPMGIVNGFIYYKFNNITIPILLHLGNNLIAFISYFLI